MHKQCSRQSLSFISGVAPLPAGLDSAPVESHRNISMAPLPMSLVSTRVELLSSPPCLGSLSLLWPCLFFIMNFLTFHFLFSLCITLIHFRGDKGIPTY